MTYIYIINISICLFFFFSSRRRHTRLTCDWSSDVCSSDLREYGVVRCVVCREELSNVIERSLGQIFHRPDKRMMKWMRYRKDELLQLLQHCSVRLIINRPAALVFNDVALSIELLLRHCGQQITHSIRFQPERQRQLV